MDPHRPISNSIVKGYSGEDTKRGAFWENNTMSKFKNYYIISFKNVYMRWYIFTCNIICNCLNLKTFLKPIVYVTHNF